MVCWNSQSSTFHISGERDVNQVYVWLTVNDSNQLGAVAESTQADHDTQGGNTANLKLNKGDVVAVQHFQYGNHIHASDAARISSFSGFLLYTTGESLSVIG